jgi:hypothetical protein
LVKTTSSTYAFAASSRNGSVSIYVTATHEGEIVFTFGLGGLR